MLEVCGAREGATAEGGQVTLAEHHEAAAELTWRFQDAEAALGIHAQDIRGGKGGGVFDEAASHRAHMAHRTERHRHAVARMRRIDACLAEMEPGQARLLQAAFAPAGRASPHLASALGVSINGRWLSLVGLALATGIAEAARDRAGAQEEPTRWLDTKATRDELRAVQASTLRALEGLVEAYGVRRLARVGREREERHEAARERRAHLKAEVAALHRRLWGAG